MTVNFRKYSKFFKYTNYYITNLNNLDDDAPLTRKEAKNFFSELKKEISDVRKLLEISGIGDYTTDETFIKVRIICKIFLKNELYFLLIW